MRLVMVLARVVLPGDFLAGDRDWTGEGREKNEGKMECSPDPGIPDMAMRRRLEAGVASYLSVEKSKYAPRILHAGLDTYSKPCPLVD